MSYHWASHSDKDLIEYADTIRFFYDPDRTAPFGWLELQNYGEVQLTSQASAKQRVVIIIGSKYLGGKWQILRGADADRVRAGVKSVSLSEHMDVLDIIRFQKAAVAHSRHNVEGHPIHWAADCAAAGLKAANCPPVTSGSYQNNRATMATLAADLVNAVRSSGSAAPVSLDLADTGFTAYYPRPGFFAGEDSKSGMDNRDLNPLWGQPWNTPTPFDRLIHEWDKLIEAGKVTSGKGYLQQRQFTPQLKSDQALHKQIKQIRCIGFRGDSRKPSDIRRAGGFFPNISREYYDYSGNGSPPVLNENKNKFGLRVLESLDAETKKRWNTVKPTPGMNKPALKQLRRDNKIQQRINQQRISDAVNSWQYDPALERFNDKGLSPNLRKYLNALMQTGQGHLGTYIADEVGGMFTSFCKSLAVVKFFATMWAGGAPFAYCYAADLRGAYHIPKTGQHQFASKAEQELAVPGAVFWPDFIAFRAIRKSDAAFDGPVWLRTGFVCGIDPAKRQAYFKDVYEILSGRDQGSGLSNGKQHAGKTLF